MQLPALPHVLITTSTSGIWAILIPSSPQHSTAQPALTPFHRHRLSIPTHEDTTSRHMGGGSAAPQGCSAPLSLSGCCQGKERAQLSREGLQKLLPPFFFSVLQKFSSTWFRPGNIQTREVLQHHGSIWNWETAARTGHSVGAGTPCARMACGSGHSPVL